MENMNNMGDWEQKNVVNELTRGKELARQLQMHLNNGSSSSPETREYLVQKILVSYEKVLSMLNFTSSGGAGDQPQPSAGVSGLMLESPPSLNESPRSEDSDRDQEHRDHASRKRKSLPRWTQQVRVNPGMELEGPLDDGFSWRKYGQKDILGAKFPRGYYRCTHRNVQGCLATKQVQRSDEDPNIFEITYRGRHTCTQASNVPALIIEKQDQSPNKTNNTEPHHQQQQTNIINQQQTTQDPHDHVLSNFRSELKVITEGLGSLDQPSVFQLQNQVHTFGAHPHVVDSSFVSGFSPSFVSPATSGTNYFSVMSTQGGNVNEHDQFGLQQQNYHHHLHHGSSESEIAEIITAATSSASNTATVPNLDFPFGHHGGGGGGGGGGGSGGSGGDDQFDPNFTFDNSGFF